LAGGTEQSRNVPVARKRLEKTGDRGMVNPYRAMGDRRRGISIRASPGLRTFIGETIPLPNLISLN